MNFANSLRKKSRRVRKGSKSQSEVSSTSARSSDRMPAPEHVNDNQDLDSPKYRHYESFKRLIGGRQSQKNERKILDDLAHLDKFDSDVEQIVVVDKPSTSYQNQRNPQLSELEETVRSGEWVPSIDGLPNHLLKSSRNKNSRRVRHTAMDNEPRIQVKRKQSGPEKWRKKGAQVCLCCCCCSRVPPYRLGWMIAFGEMALAIGGLLESSFYIWTASDNQAKYSFYIEMGIVCLWFLSSALFIIALVEHRMRLLLPHIFISAFMWLYCLVHMIVVLVYGNQVYFVSFPGVTLIVLPFLLVLEWRVFTALCDEYPMYRALYHEIDGNDQ